MDKLFELLIPALPASTIVPAIIFLLFLLGWPTLHSIWTDVLPSNRLYEREKRRLELLKLRLEILALKKQHQLDEADIAPSLPPPPPPPPPRPATMGGELTNWTRVLFGGIGGLAPPIVSFLFTFDLGMLTLTSLMGFLTRFAILFVVGGGIALATKATSRRDAVIYGAIGPLLIQLILTNLTVDRTTGSLPHA